MTGERQVTIGDTTYTIAAFSNRKVLIAGRMMRHLSETVSEINRRVAAFRTDYRERNRDVVTRQMAALPPWNELLDFMTPEAWDKADGAVELRRDPSVEEVIVEVFPLAFELAEEEVRRLLALVLIPNQELGAAALAGNASDKLDEYGVRILDDGTIGDMIDLVDQAVDVLREELEAKATKVGRIRRALRREQTPATSPTPSPDQPEETSTRKPESSTGSPAPTDGGTPTSSTVSPGERLSRSAS
jgi:hypothetical protein